MKKFELVAPPMVDVDLTGFEAGARGTQPSKLAEVSPRESIMNDSQASVKEGEAVILPLIPGWIWSVAEGMWNPQELCQDFSNLGACASSTFLHC